MHAGGSWRHRTDEHAGAARISWQAMAWWLRPCGPGAGSGRAQDAQNSPAKPVLADGECYARRTQSHIHASRGVVGLVRPLPYPSTMRAARDRTIDQSWHCTIVVRAAAAHCCSLLVLCVKAGECVDFAARLRRSAWRCSRLCRTVLGRRSEDLQMRPARTLSDFFCQFPYNNIGGLRLAAQPRC